MGRFLTPNPVTTDLNSGIVPGNVTTTTLGPGEEWIGDWVLTDSWAQFYHTLKTDVQGTLYVERAASPTGPAGSIVPVVTTIIPNEGQRAYRSPSAEYIRLRYVNGPVGQTIMRLRMYYSTTQTGSTYLQVGQDIITDDTSLITNAVISGQDQDDIFRKIRATEAGNLMVADFRVEVTRGNIPGYSYITKFGHNPLSTTGEDIWHGGGSYNFFPTTAQSMDIYSGNAADTNGGTGAWTIQVYGLDSNYDEIDEVVTMNGTTPVALANTYIRMYRAKVLTAGSNETNVGNIIIDANVGGIIGAYIAAGDGQTQQAIYTIPNSKSGIIYKWYCSLSNSNKNGEDGAFQLLSRSINGGNGAWQIKGRVGLVNIGDSSWQYEYGVPSGLVEEKTDIRIKQESASATLDSVGGFDLLLIDN